MILGMEWMSVSQGSLGLGREVARAREVAREVARAREGERLVFGRSRETGGGREGLALSRQVCVTCVSIFLRKGK